jgi:Cof subfamily protein (haloacid dehalogenase superfamily)
MPSAGAPAIRVIATDLDGTLLGEDGLVSDGNAAALRAARDAGVTVVAATGRSRMTSAPLLEPCGAVAMAVCSNGAVIHDPNRHETLHTRPIGPDALTALVDRLCRALPGVGFGWELEGRFSWDEAFVRMRPRADARRVLGGEADPWPDLTIEPVFKVLIQHPDLERDALLVAIAEHAPAEVTVAASGATFVEVTGDGVDKASGLAWVCDRLGVDRRDVLAIGDHVNDLAMLRWAGHPVAMANAHPAVLAATGRRAPSNADDGVAAVVAEVLAADAAR